MSHYDGIERAITDAPKWFYMIHLYEQLIDLDLAAVEPNVNSLQPESIVILKSDREKHVSQVYANMPKPGIMIISRGARDVPSGSNEQDDVVYQYHVYLLDRDYDQQITGLRTWLKWEHQMMQRLRYNNVDSGLQISGVSDAPFFEVESMETLEDVKWDTDNLVRAGLIITVLSREARNNG